jgi:NSS family neurotransmitter:Na+ symporter
MAEIVAKARGSWGSKLAFIFAASGSAIGLGSIWRFPIMVGQNGGAVFVFTYLLAVVFIGFMVMLAELALGRHTQKNIVGAISAVSSKPLYRAFGYFGVATGIAVFSYYSVVAGWATGYLYKTLFGAFRGDVSWEYSVGLFTRFAANPVETILCHFFVMAVTVYVISRGVQGGIEKWSKILMPMLFALIIYLAIRALMLPGAGKGVAFYLQPDLAKLSPKVLFFAAGQAFYSLSLGMGIMVTYGSYIPKRDNLVSSAGWVCLSTTLVAILAGIIIFPTLFATPGLDPANFQPGTGIMFQTFPLIISRIPGGYIFGVLFFVLLLVAALTSTFSLLEVPTAFLVDEHKWSRPKATIFIGALAFLLGIPAALANGASPALTKFKFMDKMDLVFGNILLAVGALFICLFLVHVWKVPRALEEIRDGNEKFRLRRVWVFCVRWLAPIAILLLLGFLFWDIVT